jgi:hypothetical protein
MDMAETAGGYWDVLRVRGGVLCPGCDFCEDAFPNIPRGDEAAGHPCARVGGPVEVFEYLSPKVSGHQRAECTGGGVAVEVDVATFCVMMRRPGLERRVCTFRQRIRQRAMSFRSRGALSLMAAQT